MSGTPSTDSDPVTYWIDQLLPETVEQESLMLKKFASSLLIKPLCSGKKLQFFSFVKLRGSLASLNQSYIVFHVLTQRKHSTDTR